MTLATAYPLFRDNGVSAEADTLRRLLRRPSETPSAAMFGQRRWNLDQAFEEASVPHWDGYDAAAVTREAYEAAKAFLEALPASWPSPDIAADPDGEVSFEWSRSPHRTFVVSVGPGGVANYAGLFGRARIHGMEPLLDRLLEVVSTNLARLYPEADPLAE